MKWESALKVGHINHANPTSLSAWDSIQSFSNMKRRMLCESEFGDIFVSKLEAKDGTYTVTNWESDEVLDISQLVDLRQIMAREVK